MQKNVYRPSHLDDPEGIEESKRKRAEQKERELAELANIKIIPTVSDATPPGQADKPLLVMNAVPGLDQFESGEWWICSWSLLALADTVVPISETDKFRHDVSLRPDEAGLDAYERVPIESFGKAALMGMGWRPGKGIGLTNIQ